MRVSSSSSVCWDGSKFIHKLTLVVVVSEREGGLCAATEQHDSYLQTMVARQNGCGSQLRRNLG